MEIYSVPVHKICTQIQQTVLPTKSSYIKVPSQVPLIDCLNFKQQKTTRVSETHRKNNSLTRKFIKNHMVVMYLMKHTPLLNHPETFRIYSTPLPPSQRCHLWMVPKAERQRLRPNWNDFMDQLTSEKTNSSIYVSLNQHWHQYIHFSREEKRFSAHTLKCQLDQNKELNQKVYLQQKVLPGSIV